MAESNKPQAHAMEFKYLKFDDSQVSIEERTFKGYASTFGNVDEVNDIIEAGAFKKSIKERGPNGSNQIKVLWQHSDPLGVPTVMKEDTNGLYVEGKISKTRLGDEALELMRDGVVDKMSIGFSIPKGKFEYDEKMGVRRIKEVKLYEFSPVTFPANEQASITGVKSLEGKLALLKSGAALKDEELAELQALHSQLAALLKSEPLNGTQEQIEPQVVELFDSIKQLQTFAIHRLY